MGVKPLYYCLTDGRFAIASELKSLFTLPSFTSEIDEVRVGDLLVRRFADKSNTLYRSARRLPPARTVCVRADHSSVTPYWDPRDGELLSLGSDAAYERRFRELFSQAVDCRLRTTGTVGTELSGGLDSSSVTVTARAQLSSDEQLHTISNIYDNVPVSDEREYIKAVVQADGIQPHYVNTDDVGLLVDLEDLLFHFDQPIHNIAHFAGWERAKRADEADVNILLTGALGDAVVGYGFSVFTDLLRTGRVVSLFRELDAMSDVWGCSRRDAFVNYVLQPLVPNSAYRRYQQARGEPVLEAQANPALDPTFVDRIDLRTRYKRHYEPTWGLLQSARQRHYESVMIGMLTEGLESINQRDAAFGIESRHPYADKRLVEFMLALPSTQQFTDGWPRSIVRRSLADLLPETIRTRVWKTSVDGAVVNALRREDERLRAMLDEPGLLSRYLDIDALRRAYNRFHDTPDINDARVLWRALSLWFWMD
jgi:asparagine synthase (glutamine-hydrolysing)